MSIISTILGKSLSSPIDAVGNVLDKLFTSDDERLDRKAISIRLAQKPMLVQAEIAKVQAQHRSIFVAGARPFILWVCGFALFNQFIVAPYIQFFFQRTFPNPSPKILLELIVAMLGFGLYRSVEKLSGRTK